MKKKQSKSNIVKIDFDKISSKKSFKKLPKQEISFPSKIISNEKSLVGSQENNQVSLSFPENSPVQVQKKGKKVFGRLASLFKPKPKNVINNQSPNTSKKIEKSVEESDEVAVLENEIKQKMELIKQKQEEKRLKIVEEKKKIIEEKKKIEKEKKDKEKLEKEKLVEISTKGKLKKGMSSSGIKIEQVIQDPEQFVNLDEIELIPDDISIKLCPKCNSKMKKKWVKSDGNFLIQEFICKNKLCKNEIKLEINTY